MSETSQMVADPTAFAADISGAMVALAPADPQSLVVSGGDPAEQLHVTVAYLGDDGAAIDEATRQAIGEAVAEAAAGAEALTAPAEGIITLGADDAGQMATALFLQADGLPAIHDAVMAALDARGVAPQVDYPVWVPHLTLGYGLDPSSPAITGLIGREVTFDRLVVAFAGDVTEYPLAGGSDVVGDEPADQTPEGKAAAISFKQRVALRQAGRNGEGVVVETADVVGEEAAEEPVTLTVGAEHRATFQLEDDGSARALLIVEGVQSGDGRMIQEAALDWRQPPLSWMCMFKNPEGGMGHAGAEHAGRIDGVERGGRNDVELWGAVKYDLNAKSGAEAYRLAQEGFVTGVSADLDNVVVDFENPPPPPDADLEDLFAWDPGLLIVTAGRIMGATQCGFPAFQECQVILTSAAVEGIDADGEGSDELEPALVAAAGAGLLGAQARTWLPHVPLEALVASCGAPVAPPPGWFGEPEVPAAGPVSLRVLPEGRLFGFKTWESCHIGFAGKCVPVPRSRSDYGWFQKQPLVCSDGSEVMTGPLIMDTVHPNLKWSASDAQSFYAHTGSAVADIHVYETRVGLAIAGALRPTTTPEQVRALRGSDWSPDWRPVPGGQEMVACLAVNTSGFITPALVASAGGAAAVRPGRGRVGVDLQTGRITAIIAGGADLPAGPEDLARQVADLRSEVADMRRALRPLRAERAKARLSRHAR